MPGGIFRIPPEEGADGEHPAVYLTFDDGPIPEATPWVLDLLDRYGIKATFFMVGQNVERHPQLLEEVRKRGHRVGNHTMRHMQGAKVSLERYLGDVEEAQALLQTDLFRPPHGWLKPGQMKALRSRYRVIMYDLVTRDYSRRLTAGDVLRNVRRYTRPGSIIVFHDSLKSLPRIREALPAALEGLMKEGYRFELL